MSTETETPAARPTEADLLEKGLKVFQRVLNQPVQVTRADMADLLNFEITVANLVKVMRQLQGKTPDELLALRREIEEKQVGAN